MKTYNKLNQVAFIFHQTQKCWMAYLAKQWVKVTQACDTCLKNFCNKQAANDHKIKWINVLSNVQCTYREIRNQ